MKIPLCLILVTTVLFVGCSERFGAESGLGVERADLSTRVRDFCEKNNRPPTAEEVGFNTNELLHEWYWLISDYRDRTHDEYVVLLVDKSDYSVTTIYTGKR